MPSKTVIFKAADLLSATKGVDAVTIESVRLLIGYGSKSDIGAALKEWRSVRRMPVSVPQVVAVKAQALATQLYMLARWDSGLIDAGPNPTDLQKKESRAVPVAVGKGSAKLSIQLRSFAEMLDRDLLTDRSEALRKLDQLNFLIALEREKITTQARLEEFIDDPKPPPRGSRKPQKREDQLTPVVERILFNAKRALLPGEIHAQLSPSMQENFDVHHFGRALDRRSWPGKIARWEGDRRRWRHLDVPLSAEKPKRKTYERVDTPRAKKRNVQTVWMNEALAWYRTHPGPWTADDVFARIKENDNLENIAIDINTFRRMLHRRSYYTEDLERVTGATPYTFRSRRS
jgi:Plasmid replication region DNA-binding N-term